MAYREFDPECVWPERPCGLVSLQAKDGDRVIISGTGVTELPTAVTHEAVLGQGATLAELGKADRNAAAHGLAILEDGLVREVETLFATGRLPGDDMRPVQQHHGFGSVWCA